MNFLFDLYGTLVDIHTDEEKLSLWQNMCELLGEDRAKALNLRAEYKALCAHYASERAHEYVEFDLLDVFDDMLAKRTEYGASARELAREFRVASREKFRVFPCVKEILTGLRERGAGVYLVSNAQECFTLDELSESGLLPLFDGILISSNAGVKKPSPEIFEMAFKRFSLDRESCIYVGNDLKDDVLGAHRAGIKSVYIETEQSGHYDFELPTPDYIVGTHEQMKETLFELANT